MNLELALHRIMKEVLCRLHGIERENWACDEGFTYLALGPEYWKQFATAEDLAEHKLAVEILCVTSELLTHYHNRSTAVMMILGKEHGFPTPFHARGYLGDGWAHLREGDELRIKKGMTHGFRVNPGGEIYVLAVQSPPAKNDTFFVTLP